MILGGKTLGYSRLILLFLFLGWLLGLVSNVLGENIHSWRLIF